MDVEPSTMAVSVFTVQQLVLMAWRGAIHHIVAKNMWFFVDQKCTRHCWNATKTDTLCYKRAIISLEKHELKHYVI